MTDLAPATDTITSDGAGNPEAIANRHGHRERLPRARTPILQPADKTCQLQVSEPSRPERSSAGEPLAQSADVRSPRGVA